MKLIPLGDRIVVRRDESEAKSKGGIVIPDVAKQRSRKGEVLAVGEGKLLDDRTVLPMRVRVGQTVMFSHYAGSEIELDGEEYLVMGETDILGILN